MLVRPLILAALAGAVVTAAPSVAHAAGPLCKPGHVLDAAHGLCYDPAAAYRPNIPAQQPVFGSGSPPTAAPPEAAPMAPGPAASPSRSGRGLLGWLGDQARFCRYGDKQVGSGDAAYCVGRDGKPYPAGK
jgi:hypothetical protein